MKKTIVPFIIIVLCTMGYFLSQPPGGVSAVEHKASVGSSVDNSSDELEEVE